ncbi:hypothetical protein HOU03_gp111 [Caulobacter phage CcrSC]|uniref:Uncharacterized protein n=1 Tax=Caulobacter phage CcrSC TaxID=2283272 RepID=A0A385ED35_9CAUD|nr:hypothetical protein HOU03_gp111 [Caulobacter phage CcrSC]AXQ69693.1 hypothetical protein CcrSC_gp111 [Caulobacter phage CcrSC]
MDVEAYRKAIHEATHRRLALENPCRECGALGTLKIEGSEDSEGYYRCKPCEACAGKGWIKKPLAEVMAMRFGPEWPTVLTPRQKLMALENRFYSRQTWTPKAGDLYTTSRADYELYEIVDIDTDDHTTHRRIRTRYRAKPDGPISEWFAHEFLSEHTFGYARTHVPNWIFAVPEGPAQGLAG